MTYFRLAVVLLFFLISLCHSDQSQKPPKATYGFLDLSTWNLKKNGPVQLDGEWEFFWQSHLSYESLQKQTQPTYMKVPGQWQGRELNGETLPREGFATLRLKVRLSVVPTDPLAFKIKRWSNPFDLYINDKKITSVGVVGTSPKEEQYDSRPHIAKFKPPADTFDLIMQVSNFTGKKSSCDYPILMGLESDLLKERVSSLAWHYIIFGAIFVIGLCLVLAYMSIRPFHIAILYLGLACLSISLRSLFMGEAIINDLVPNLNTALKFKLELSLLYSFVIFVNLFGRALFPVELKLWFIRVIWISHAAFITIVLLFNYDIALYTQLPHHIITAFDGVYVLYVLGRAIEIRRRGAVIFMSSLGVFFIAALHDMLVFHHIIETPYILHFGFLGFIIIQTFLVTYLYSKSRGNVLQLTQKLDTTQKQLQELKINTSCEEINIDPFCNKYKITSREKEVVKLIVQGASNNEIAEKMYISFHTVRRHLNNIYRKGDVSERNELLEMIKDHSENNQQNPVGTEAG